MGAPALRVLIADRHAPVRAGLRLLLEREPGIAVVGEAGDGRAAVARVARPSDDPGVDVVLAALDLPGLDGAEVARRIKAQRPRVRVLLLGLGEEAARVAAALAAGADGFLHKETAPAHLAAALRAVARGRACGVPPAAGVPDLPDDAGASGEWG